MSVSVIPVDNTASNTMNLELFCSICDSYFGWYRDDPAGIQDAERHALLHESKCKVERGKEAE